MTKTSMMHWLKRSVAVGVLASMVSGCMMYRLEELRNTTPQGSPFQKELSRLYMEFATSEEKEYDWQDSWYFADKGLMAAYGNETQPEELSGWDIDDEGARAELEKARIRVMDALTPALKDGAPTRAAAIQFNFDCWVEQQEEGWQLEDIAECRGNLMHALNEASDFVPAKKPKPAPAAKAPAPKPAPVAEKVPFEKEKPASVMPDKPKDEAKKDVAAETASYAVFFETGKADVSAPGKNVLNEVVSSVKGKSGYVVVLHVAPLPGSATQEKDLPAKRISVVKKVLTDGGVDSGAIVKDDSPEAAKPVSRRIELFLNE